MNVSRSDQIVVLHGLWFGAWAMKPLARRLAGFAGKESDCYVRRFSYRSTKKCLDDHARALHDFVRQQPANARHYVAHSYGGLVTLRMFALFPQQPPGRIVLLGSPLRGSRVARKANRVPGSGFLTGAARPDLERGYCELPPGHATAMIAGTRRFGVGWLVGEFRMPGDGTVALEETQVEGLAEFKPMRLTHTGLVTARSASRQASHYLEYGQFLRDD